MSGNWDGKERRSDGDLSRIVEGHHKTLYGDDGAHGIVAWINSTNGHIKGIVLMLKIGLPIIAGINLAIFGALLVHLGK